MSTHSPQLVTSPQVLDFISHSAAQTIRIGQRLGELLQQSDVILLMGDFGAGKTHFTKGVAQGLGSPDMVNSPSFVLINEYRAGPQHHHMPIFHVDLYRIDDTAELVGIGLDDALSGDGVCLIEWGDRAVGWFPAERLDIHLRHLSETKRVIRLTPHGARASALIEAFKNTAFA